MFNTDNRSLLTRNKQMYQKNLNKYCIGILKIKKKLTINSCYVNYTDLVSINIRILLDNNKKLSNKRQNWT